LQKGNDLIGIYVVEKESGEIIGRVEDILYSPVFSSITGIVINNKNKFFCDVNNINKIGEDIIIIKDKDKIDIIDKNKVIDSTLIKMPKAYPAYFGTYKDLGKVIDYVSKIENLFLIGRNGMHRYNNMDHSMLTAMLAVENIINNKKSKENIWEVNAEKEYHEKK